MEWKGSTGKDCAEEEGSENEEDYTTVAEVMDKIEMSKNSPKEDLRKKYHREWRAYVDIFAETLIPEDIAYLRMEENKWKWMKKTETGPKTAQMEEEKDEKDPKTEEVEEKKVEKEMKTEEVEEKKVEKEMKTEEVEEKKSDWKAKNAKRPVIDID